MTKQGRSVLLSPVNEFLRWALEGCCQLHDPSGTHPSAPTDSEPDFYLVKDKLKHVKNVKHLSKN